MSTEHRADHDELLQRWVLDGPEGLSEAQRQELETCLTCAARHAELVAVRGGLDAGAARERDGVLREAQRLASYPGEERAQEALRGLMAASGPVPAAAAGPRAQRWLPWLGLAAAALALALGAWLFRDGGGEELPDGLQLTGGGIEALSPLGEVSDYELFAWSDVDAGGWYRLTIRDPQDPARPDTVIEDLEEPRWEPDDEQREQLPARLEWRVEALGPGGASMAFGGGRAWRLPP